MKPIQAWSFSSLSVFETCAYRAYLAKILKIPEPDRPPPPKGGEHANDRGSRIHDRCEGFVRGERAEIPVESKEFEKELENARKRFSKNKVIMEEMWCFDNAWKSVSHKAFKQIWLRMAIDIFIWMSKIEAVIVDHKTGKKFGNEIKHTQQGQLYVLAAFLRFPQLEKIHVEFWYHDAKDLTRITYTRAQAMRFFKNWNERGIAMTTCKAFAPFPNRSSCMFCPYGPKHTSNKWVNKSGDCRFGV